MSAPDTLFQADAPRMTVNEVRRRAADALLDHPLLTKYGLPDGRSTADERDFDYEAVRTAVLFLLEFGRHQRDFNGETSSYRLKHCAENWGDESGLSSYVANGELILGALICGYRYRQFDGGASLNCDFNLTPNAEMQRYDWHVYGRGPK